MFAISKIFNLYLIIDQKKWMIIRCFHAEIRLRAGFCGPWNWQRRYRNESCLKRNFGIFGRRKIDFRATFWRKNLILIKILLCFGKKIKNRAPKTLFEIWNRALKTLSKFWNRDLKTLNPNPKIGIQKP